MAWRNPAHYMVTLALTAATALFASHTRAGEGGKSVKSVPYQTIIEEDTSNLGLRGSLSDDLLALPGKAYLKQPDLTGSFPERTLAGRAGSHLYPKR